MNFAGVKLVYGVCAMSADRKIWPTYYSTADSVGYFQV